MYCKNVKEIDITNLQESDKDSGKKAVMQVLDDLGKIGFIPRPVEEAEKQRESQAVEAVAVANFVKKFMEKHFVRPPGAKNLFPAVEFGVQFVKEFKVKK